MVLGSGFISQTHVHSVVQHIEVMITIDYCGDHVIRRDWNILQPCQATCFVSERNKHMGSFRNHVRRKIESTRLILLSFVDKSMENGGRCGPSSTLPSLIVRGGSNN